MPHRSLSPLSASLRGIWNQKVRRPTCMQYKQDNKNSDFAKVLLDFIVVHSYTKNRSWTVNKKLLTAASEWEDKQLEK